MIFGEKKKGDVKMSNSYEGAKERIPSQRDRILDMLRSAGSEGVLNIELQTIAIRWLGRVGELYEQGYKIDVVPMGKGVYKYTLIEEPIIKLTPKKAMDIFYEKVKQFDNECVSLSQLKGILDEEGFNIVRKFGSHK